MSTIAIVGAGRGIGAAVARRFGREGFRVALFSRNQAKLDGLAAELSEQNITALGFAVDVRDSIALTVALEAASSELGPIEVLQYSPIPHRDFLKPISETSITDLTGAVEFSIYGPFTAVQQVLPYMRSLRRGTIVFVNGGTSVRPRAQYAGTSIAFAGESAYAQVLHEAFGARKRLRRATRHPRSHQRRRPRQQPRRHRATDLDTACGTYGFPAFPDPDRGAGVIVVPLLPVGAAATMASPSPSTVNR